MTRSFVFRPVNAGEVGVPLAIGYMLIARSFSVGDCEAVVRTTSLSSRNPIRLIVVICGGGWLADSAAARRLRRSRAIQALSASSQVAWSYDWPHTARKHSSRVQTWRGWLAR